MIIKENTLEEFQAVAQPVMEWLKENGHLHNTVVITPYYAKVTSDDMGIVDTETKNAVDEPTKEEGSLFVDTEPLENIAHLIEERHKR